MPRAREPVAGTLAMGSVLIGETNLEVVLRVVEVAGELDEINNFFGRFTLTRFLKSSLRRLCNFLTSIFLSCSFLSDDIPFPKIAINREATK